MLKTLSSYLASAEESKKNMCIGDMTYHEFFISSFLLTVMQKLELGQNACVKMDHLFA